MSAERPFLAALARHLGIVASYWDIAGRERITSDATREALLAAMGFDASDEERAARALVRLEREEGERLLAPVRVFRATAGARPNVPLRLPSGFERGDWRLELVAEDDQRHVAEGRFDARADPGATRQVVLPLPEGLPHGYYTMRVELDAAPGTAGPLAATQRFVMAPHSALSVDEVPGAAGSFGLWTNLYTVRGRRDWGFGDLGVLEELLVWCGEIGGEFVGVNPLHAIPNRGWAITPYSPSSRIYRNPLYIDVEAVPELEACAAARARLRDPAFRERLAALRQAGRIEHGAVLDAKREVLRLLWHTFRSGGGATARAAAFARYREREGAALRDFATWEVLAETFGRPEAPATDWRAWPAPFRDPHGAAVARFRAEHADEVEFRAWLQFELDEQLARAAVRGRAAGLAIGIYQDLAVGSAPDSADTWLAQGLFAHGANVGAPPDAYAPEGQDWGFPPLDPRRLHADGYRFFSHLLRASFAHAGALRIDHAMGLMRLFWIPEGRPGSEGTYVHYPLDDLLGILALESRRAGALVIAEDLGTVPPEFRDALASWSILGSAVLWFERDERGFRPAASYPKRVLATVGTHDLAPLAGHRDGTDLALRRRIGLLADDAALAEARAARAGEYAALLDLLRREGLLPPEGEPDETALCAALHGFLARTPAALVAASLDDLAGEREPVNVPGASVERHPSWSRRMDRPLGALAADPRVAAALAPLVARRGARARGARG